MRDDIVEARAQAIRAEVSLNYSGKQRGYVWGVHPIDLQLFDEELRKRSIKPRTKLVILPVEIFERLLGRLTERDIADEELNRRLHAIGTAAEEASE